MLIRVTPEPLDPAEATRAVERPAAGAVTLFFGNVRDTNLGRDVQYLYYDAYPSMAEKVMTRLGAQAIERFGLEDVAIMHRTGRLEIGETSLLVAVSHGHRREAFEAGLWLVDEIKRHVPVWKKEVWAEGDEWIEGPEAFGREQAPASMRG
jgi:molybdopterin synthase catalytic subunit